MVNSKNIDFLKNTIANIPNDWIRYTTHRLDIYNESLAKTEFLTHFEELLHKNEFSESGLNNLPTAFDYIRLGHPLSCILEWKIAQNLEIHADNVICFSSQIMPVLAVLRKNLLENKKTQILYQDSLPSSFDADLIQKIYNYSFELVQISDDLIPSFDGSTIFISKKDDLTDFTLNDSVDFYVNFNDELGSIIVVNGESNKETISEIQHVRRRESIAMTPADTLIALNKLVGNPTGSQIGSFEEHKKSVVNSIKEITQTDVSALIGSSGLSIQYAIVMGLIHDAQINYPDIKIKIIVPPNCYGGTNDQARRVAACNDLMEVIDLPVDGKNNMVDSIDRILDEIKVENALPIIITEIPTNPRVEVPDLKKLEETLSKDRGSFEPIFVLDQTFCPNVHFLGENEILSSVKTIAYVSGSKFPSGGKCTAGYCTSNQKAKYLMEKIGLHLEMCDNEATVQQMAFLAEQMPSMTQRIADAYQNTRKFVSFIEEKLPTAKINFVSEELVQQGFTPSVFSMDLPTKGNSEEEREAYKRELNLKLINMMIQKIPTESKFCVSYGQLKGCYWTIPATSTQGTTKEGDKDYIVRVALSGNMDLKKHMEVFEEFVNEYINS